MCHGLDQQRTIGQLDSAAVLVISEGTLSELVKVRWHRQYIARTSFEQRNIDCTSSDSAVGIPAGGCAFSYPVVSNSTCRLKIFGKDETRELQWCQNSLTTTMVVGNGTDGTTNPLACPCVGSCASDDDWDTLFSFGGTCGDSFSSPSSCETGDTYQNKWILFGLGANTLVEMDTCDSPTASSSSFESGSAWEIAAIILICVTIVLCVLVIFLAYTVNHLRGSLRDQAIQGTSCTDLDTTVHKDKGPTFTV